jgi:hypothetical protein
LLRRAARESGESQNELTPELTPLACVYWKTAEDLKAKVIIGSQRRLKRRPADGWVRADRIPSEATLADVLAL